jgi:ABC-2 type transport system ATP-binding protein
VRESPSVVLDDVGLTLDGRPVLQSVTLCLGVGLHAVHGPNGAGKTSLLRLLATAVAPSEGRLVLLGREPGDAAGLRQTRRELGYLPQHFGAYPRFTVQEAVEYSAWLREVPRHRVRRDVATSLERVGLQDRARTPVRTLSGGMVRRLGIAQALVNAPRLLVLDEPTTGLDDQHSTALHAVLREIAASSVVVVSTHDTLAVDAVADTVTTLLDGRVDAHRPCDPAVLDGQARGA